MKVNNYKKVLNLKLDEYINTDFENFIEPLDYDNFPHTEDHKKFWMKLTKQKKVSFTIIEKIKLKSKMIDSLIAILSIVSIALRLC